MLVNLTRCMRYLDDVSVTRLLVSRERQTSFRVNIRINIRIQAVLLSNEPCAFKFFDILSNDVHLIY